MKSFLYFENNFFNKQRFVVVIFLAFNYILALNMFLHLFCFRLIKHGRPFDWRKKQSCFNISFEFKMFNIRRLKFFKIREKYDIKLLLKMRQGYDMIVAQYYYSKRQVNSVDGIFRITCLLHSKVELSLMYSTKTTTKLLPVESWRCKCIDKDGFRVRRLLESFVSLAYFPVKHLDSSFSTYVKM